MKPTVEGVPTVYAPEFSGSSSWVVSAICEKGELV